MSSAITTKNSQAGLISLAGAIGLVYDRTAVGGDSICSAWLVDNNKVATVANALVPFVDHLKALKVCFPKAGKTCGVSAIQFHPRFDRKAVHQLMQQGALLDAPEVALRKFNFAVLILSDDLKELSVKEVEGITKFMRAPLSGGEDDFVGSLKQIELPLILQTINSARQEGVLYVCDDLGRPQAQIFCQGGKIVAARFKNLINESAVYQIVAKRLNGKFAFKSGATGWLPPKLISQPADMILIESHRRLDELENIKSQLKASNAYFVKTRAALDKTQLQGDFAQLSDLWRVLDGMTVADQLWQLVGSDDYTIFKGLQELHARGLIRRVQDGGTRQIKISPVNDTMLARWAPLRLDMRMPLFPNDELTAIGLDVDKALVTAAKAGGLASVPKGAGLGYASRVESGAESILDPAVVKTRVKTGSLLGAIDPYDTWHILHAIPLLPEAAGIPIFKDGCVVGMHCGLIPSAEPTNGAAGGYQQMLWVQSIIECLEAGGDATLVRKLTAEQDLPTVAGPNDAPQHPPGCNEIAQLKCPSCAEETFDSARFCKKCHYNFIPEPVYKAALPLAKIALCLCGALLLGALVMVAVTWSSLPGASFQSPQLISTSALNVTAGSEPIALKMLVADPDQLPLVWKPSGNHIRTGELVQFVVKAAQPTYVYLLYKGQASDRSTIIYPASIQDPVLVPANSNFQSDMFEAQPPNGTDLVLAVASKTPVQWMKDAGAVDSFFEYAIRSLSAAGNANGLILDVVPAGTPDNAHSQCFVISIAAKQE